MYTDNKAATYLRPFMIKSCDSTANLINSGPSSTSQSMFILLRSPAYECFDTQHKSKTACNTFSTTNECYALHSSMELMRI